MNRRQVAQRLGKSLATVRRIEGVLLHPERDARGTYRFDSEEVEAVARGVESGSVTLWQEIRRGQPAPPKEDSLANFGSDGCSSCSALEDELVALRHELEEVLGRHRRALEARHVEHERAKATFMAERRAFERQVADFMAAVAEVSD